MQGIEDLLRRLREGEIVPKLAVSDTNLLSLLDMRDRDAFSLSWMEAFRRVEAAKAMVVVNQAIAERVATMRELSYLQAFEQWKSSDLAAYISDDIGLIADAIAAAYADPWVNWLLGEYLDGRFPVTGIATVGGSGSV